MFFLYNRKSTAIQAGQRGSWKPAPRISTPPTGCPGRSRFLKQLPFSLHFVCHRSSLLSEDELDEDSSSSPLSLVFLFLWAAFVSLFPPLSSQVCLTYSLTFLSCHGWKWLVCTFFFFVSPPCYSMDLIWFALDAAGICTVSSSGSRVWLCVLSGEVQVHFQGCTACRDAGRGSTLDWDGGLRSAEGAAAVRAALLKVLPLEPSHRASLTTHRCRLLSWETKQSNTGRTSGDSLHLSSLGLSLLIVFCTALIICHLTAIFFVIFPLSVQDKTTNQQALCDESKSRYKTSLTFWNTLCDTNATLLYWISWKTKTCAQVKAKCKAKNAANQPTMIPSHLFHISQACVQLCWNWTLEIYRSDSVTFTEKMTPLIGICTSTGPFRRLLPC